MRRFQLGGIFGGKIFHYTEIPAFDSLELALAAQAKRPGRNACDLIIEEIPAMSHGVRYGTRHVYRSAIDGEPLPAL